MKLPERYIEELAKELFGQDTIPLILLIKDKENVSEFKIAERLGITINQVRNILYRLNEHNLVDSTRKKDRKKGWYIYFWTFDNEKAKDLLVKHKRKKIATMQSIIAAEEKSIFYVCPNSCTRIDNAQALECEFKCTECNSLLKEENREKKRQQMTDQIQRITKEIEELQQAIVEKEPRLKKKLLKQKKPITKPATRKEEKKPARKTAAEVKKHQIGLLKRVKSRLFRRF